MDLVLLFPGQGSQAPGMGRELAERHPAARDVFARADAALGTALSTLCWEGPAEELTLTHNAQPALLTHGAAVWAAVQAAAGAAVRARVRAAAGHSLGEFTAYHAAGALSLEDAVRVVRRRGELMYETGVARPGAMAAILGEPSEPIDTICERASAEAGTVVAANFNCPGQLVISGEVAGVERAMAMVKEAGAKRAIRLNVSGAFHSPLMAPAADGLRETLDLVSFGSPEVPIVANVDASYVSDAGTARSLLVRQLTAPVRWTQVIEALAARHPEALYVEMGPGSVLGGLVKKIAPQLRTMACGTAADVDTLVEQLA